MNIKNLFAVYYKKYLAMVHDACVVPLAWLLAYAFRFNFSGVPQAYIDSAIRSLPYLIVVQFGINQLFGLYRGIWRYASLPDVIRMVKAVALGSLLSMLLLFLATRLQGVPRVVFPLYVLLLFNLLIGPRLLYRLYKDRWRKRQSYRRALIVGAGRAGEALVRELLRDPNYEYKPVGFLEINPRKIGREIHGVRVLGDYSIFKDVVREQRIDRVLIARPSARADEMRSLTALCHEQKVPVHTLPGLNELMDRNARLRDLRDVSLDDLLGRDPVALDWTSIQAQLHQRVVLVTGGGGSIGAELCRQIARFKPSLLVILEISEFTHYQLGMTLKAQFPHLAWRCYLGSVTDRARVRQIMQRHQPAIVFHAAAYKHVPILEQELCEAVRNNVLGTQVVLEEALASEAAAFVQVSSDKAVNPTNVMGATKRAAEILCQNYDRKGKMRCITVRFGNVLGSSGSVVPLFQKQIAAGGPVTITDPNISRYFMTLSEACQLIVQAVAVGQGGEIFVLDMGEPVKIQQLAEHMIRLAGKTKDEIAIEYTGLRPGEKLFEELFHQGEQVKRTGHAKLLRAESRKWQLEPLQRIVLSLQQACIAIDEAALQRLLLQLVPEAQLRAKRAASPRQSPCLQMSTEQRAHENHEVTVK